MAGSRKFNRHTTVYEEVEVDISLDDFTDEAILEEAQDRGLVPYSGSVEDVCSFAPREDAHDIQRHFMCRRVDKGIAELRMLVEKFVPAQILAALDAAREGNVSAAICELDHFIQPTPAATATTLPVKSTETATTTRAFSST